MNESTPAPSLPELLDVAPPVPVPADPLHWGWWLALALVLAILAWLLVIFLRRPRQTVGESARERALRRLDELESQVAEMDGYHFGVVVSDILRSYLTEAHALHASQQTSQEFLRDLESQNRFSETRQQHLREFLQSCDFLKFAPAGKAAAPNRELLQQARFFIQEDLT